MKQVKDKLINYQSNLLVIERLIDLYSNKTFESKEDNVIISQLKDLRDGIRSIDINNMNTSELISEIINNNYHEIYSELYSLNHSKIAEEKTISEADLSERYRKLTYLLQTEILKSNALLNSYINNTRNIYNSENYYKERILELENEKRDLQNYLDQQKNNVVEKREEIAENKRINQEKEIALLKANEQIEQYKSELEEKKKKENIIVEWNSKIKSTFDELTKCLTPIKDEHTRLNRMFWVYSILSIFVILIIIFLECYIFCKLHNSTDFPKWKNYFPAITPIPVFGGLLWAFIIQLNRTQRQILILAKHIHEIKYVEGLLLSINSLSLDINDSTKRVNLAIDRLLDNHLNSNNNSNSITEQEIIKEEKKDYVPIDTVLKLLKETKGIIGK